VTSITHKAIPEGSYEVRIFAGDDVPEEADITTVLVLENLGDDVCEVALAHGHLSHEYNVLIAMKAVELGFKRIVFSVLKGKKVTRLAEYLRSDKRFDYYTVDLMAALEEYNK
jgi:hypothetical protein